MMERLFAYYRDAVQFKNNVKAYYATDDKLRQTIKEVWEEKGYVICPHTACGEFVRRNWYKDDPTIVVATAHPAKFETIVEPLVGKSVAVPESLYSMLGKEENVKTISPDYTQLF